MSGATGFFFIFEIICLLILSFFVGFVFLFLFFVYLLGGGMSGATGGATSESSSSLEWARILSAALTINDDGTRATFAKFSRSFHKFFGVFVGSETCLDLFGPSRMRSDTFGYARKHSDVFGKFSKKFRNCAKYRRSQ